MRQRSGSIECEKYESMEIEGYKIVLGKETNKSITSTAEMVRECLNCGKHKEGCKRGIDFVHCFDQ